MPEQINEPQLTAVLEECSRRMIDPLSVVKFIGETAFWVEEEPVISDRDMEILSLDVEGYDEVQITLSRMVPKHGEYERETLKTKHLPMEVVKEYLGESNKKL